MREVREAEVHEGGAPGSPHGRGRRIIPLVVAAAVGTLLIVTLRGFVFDEQGAAGENRNCLPLTVVSSSNKAQLLDEMAKRFEESGAPSVDGRCVDVRVASKPSGAAIEALGRGWDETTDGPRPDVWSPASSAWVTILRHRLAERSAPDMVAQPLPSLAKSPQVIAMPRPMAVALGWPNEPIGWRDILELATDPAGWGKVGHEEWGPFRLGKTEMTQSTSALNATIGTFLAATGKSADLTKEDIDDADVQAFVRGVESSVVHYGDTSLAFLENLRRADDAGATLKYLSAVILEEKSVWDYNKGNPSGDPRTLGRRAPPKVPLVAVYPEEGTLLADHPYAVLDAAWVDDSRRRAAADFLAFVQAKEQQRRFQRAAFRDHQGAPGFEITASNGLLPHQPHEVGPPEPHILDAIQRSWRGVRKPARVLLVLDVSGSMSSPVRGAEATKLELAQRAIGASLSQLDGDDEVGLWVFPAERSTEGPFAELVPVSPLASSSDDLARQLSALSPRGPAPLYATLDAAVQRLRAGFTEDRINGIVLVTDGRNEVPPSNLERLLEMLEDEAGRSGVQLYPVAYGEAADRDALRKMAAASRTAAYDARDPADIEAVMAAVVSNF